MLTAVLRRTLQCKANRGGKALSIAAGRLNLKALASLHLMPPD
jgi:hypothetical protein